MHNGEWIPDGSAAMREQRHVIQLGLPQREARPRHESEDLDPMVY